MHDFDETWISLCHSDTKKMKSSTKTANINTETLEVISLL